jgi:Mrp family chromosome partitioning ATPase
MQGARVGIFDADIYGPSLPLLVSPESDAVFRRDDGSVTPVMAHGIACMSYGWVASKNAAGERTGAVMRGPMVSQVVQQLAQLTDWGELDYLIVDSPPGTGDIHLTLGQHLSIAAAVIVTTPHGLSEADVVKGVDMFRSLKVEPVALVENMSYFDGDDGKRYHPLGEGGAVSLAKKKDIGDSFELPMEVDMSASGEDHVPFVLSHGDSETADTYRALAGVVANHVGTRTRSFFSPLLTSTHLCSPPFAATSSSGC